VKPPRKAIRALLVLLLSGLAVFIIMLRWFEHSQVFHPDRALDATGAELGRPFENVFFNTSDGVALNGWFYPAKTNSPRRGLAILVCHGNAGNISHRLALCQALLETGVNVFLFDYRGYGRSGGHPTEEGTYRDAQAAYHWLRQKGFTARSIVAYGESLGGGVAAELATREQVGAIILQSTFSSIPELGTDIFPWLPVRWIAKIRYETARKLPRLRIPVLVMHSREDRLINFRHCERNFAAANEPKLLCELSGDHNDALTQRDRFVPAVERLLQLLENQTALAK
jgi:fermentation-respiration switch protein FrsA (DUF1100 family)